MTGDPRLDVPGLRITRDRPRTELTGKLLVLAGIAAGTIVACGWGLVVLLLGWLR